MFVVGVVFVFVLVFVILFVFASVFVIEFIFAFVIVFVFVLHVTRASMRITRPSNDELTTSSAASGGNTISSSAGYCERSFSVAPRCTMPCCMTSSTDDLPSFEVE